MIWKSLFVVPSLKAKCFYPSCGVRTPWTSEKGEFGTWDVTLGRVRFWRSLRKKKLKSQGRSNDREVHSGHCPEVCAAVSTVYSTVNGRKRLGSLTQREGGAGKRSCGRDAGKITASPLFDPPLATFQLPYLQRTLQNARSKINFLDLPTLT